jgi:predicted nucleic acid-binding protein
MIFLDSSFYVSLVIQNDVNHRKAENLAKNIRIKKITSEDILKETLTIVSQRKGKAAVARFYEDVLEDTEILPITTNRYTAGLQLFMRPTTQKDISLIDCITAALCREIGVKTILTFDRHFRTLDLTVRP